MQIIFFLGRLIQGIGEAPIWALAPALLSIKYPYSKGKVMGVYNASIHTGLTIGPIIGIILSKYWLDNQAFLFYAMVCFLGSLVIYFFVDDVRSNDIHDIESLNFSSILQLITNKETLITLFGINLYGAGYGIFLSVIPAFLISVKNFSASNVGVFFSLFYIAISLSQVITGPLSDKIGRKAFMMLGLIIAFMGIFIFPILNQPWISLVLTLTSLGLGVFYLSSMAFLNDIVPNSFKGTISGAYYLFWGIGMFFGPVLVSKLGTTHKSNLGFYVFSITLFFEVITMLIYFNKTRYLRMDK